MEVRYRCKIRELKEELQETVCLKKEVESERKLQERDTKSEQVEYSLYVMVNRLKKQLEEKDKQLQESNRAISELKATLKCQCKEICEIKCSEAYFERESANRQNRELAKRLQEEQCNNKNVCGSYRALTLSLLMSYIYEAPSKARNFNVVYKYGPTFGSAESRLFLFAAPCFNTESMQRGFRCHSCV